MGLQQTLVEIEHQLTRLRLCWKGIGIFAGDKPPGHGDSWADTFRDRVQDLGCDILSGLENVKAAREAEQAGSLDQVRRNLAQCQAAYQSIAQRLSGDLSYETVAMDLDSLARSKGEWPSWAGVLRNALRSSHTPTQELVRALFAGWQELAHALASSKIQVNTTNIGQNFTVPTAEAQRDDSEVRIPTMVGED